MGTELSYAAIGAVLVALLALGVSLRASQREAQAEARFPPTGQIVEVDGTPVHARVVGAGPDLVLIHGAGGNLRDLTFDLVGRLSDRYRVIVFDRPGHGYTGYPDAGDPTSGDSPRAQARLLQAAARQLGVTSPVVLGHSFGGAVAMAWALEAPEDTAALVILSGATMPWEGALDLSYRIYANPVSGAVVVPLITAFAPRSVTQSMLKGVFDPQPMPEGYLAHFGLPLAIRRDSMRSNARQVTTLRKHLTEMSGHYPTIAIPVELLHGTADTIVGLTVHAEPLSRILPDAHLTPLDGVGHMPHHAVPAQVEAAIDRAAARAGLTEAY